MALTKNSTTVNNIQTLADLTLNQATAVKVLHDKAGSDIKTYINDVLTVELDALDAANVKKTGDQTIAGVKTFQSSPIVPTPTTDFQASTKKYIDDLNVVQTSALNTHKSSTDHNATYYTKTQIDTNLATKSEVQGITLGQIPDGTITEAKLSPEFISELDNSFGINVTWRGVNESVLDNSPLYGAIIEDLDTGSESITGGRIKIPRGTFKGQLIITTTHASNLASIIVEGSGQQNTILSGTGLTANKNVIEVQGGVFVKIKDLQTKNATGHGIAVLGQQSGDTVWNHLQMENVRSSANTKSGIYLERGFMANFQDVFSTNNSNYGFELKGYHTSLNFTNCYGVNNAYDNFLIEDASYSTFEDCGSDGAGQFGYRIRNCVAVGFKNCGAESCQRSGFMIEASAAIEATSYINNGTEQVSFDGCYAFNCDLAGGGYGNFLNARQLDTSKINGIKISNCYDKTPFGSNSIVINGSDIDIIEDNNKFVADVSYLGNSERKLVKYPLNTGGIAITTNTPIASLKNDYEHTSNYGGTLVVTARNVSQTTASANTATYVLFVGKHVSGSSIAEIAKNGMTDGGGASYPSFTFTLDTTNNKLLASVVGSTSGTFYFAIESQGCIAVSKV